MKSFEFNKQKTMIKPDNSFFNKEILVSADSVFSIKIDVDQTIDYTNHQYNMTSGFEAYELIKEPIDVLFHEDMPDLIVSKLREAFSKGQSIQLIQKFVASDDRYFWLSSVYEPKVNSKGNITSYSCVAVPLSIFAVERISALYTILSKIEKKAGIEAAKSYLLGFFENENTDYHSFVKKLSAITISRKEQAASIDEIHSTRNHHAQQTQFTAEQYRVFTKKTPKTDVEKTNNSLRRGA